MTRAWVLASVALVACEQLPSVLVPSPKAAVIVAPPLADLPAAVVMKPCPAGWVERGDLCEPWPEGPQPACGVDEARFTGSAACVRVGAPCPAGDWADLPAGATVVYVNPDAGAVRNGSRATPFATMTEAVTAATAAPGSIIALSKGLHYTAGGLPPSTTLWGACVAQTVVDVPPASTPAVVQATGPGVVVTNLRLTGRRPGMLALGAGAELTARDVIVDGATGIAWVAQSGAVSHGDHVVIRRTQTTGGSLGTGIEALQGGRIDGRFVVVEGAFEHGVLAKIGGASVDLADVAVLDTRAAAGGGNGYGVDSAQGTEIRLTRAIIAGSAAAGVVGRADSGITLTDVVVRGSGNGADLLEGGVITEGALTATRLSCDRNEAPGIIIAGDGVAWVEDVNSSRNDGTDAGPAYGTGLIVRSGARATVSRGIFEDNSGPGVLVGTGNLNATDFVVRQTRALAGTESLGLGILASGAFSADRVLVDRVSSTGVWSLSADAGIVLTNVTIRGTQDTVCRGCLETKTAGMMVMTGGGLRARRFFIENDAGIGALLAEGQLDLQDGEITGHEIGINVMVPGYDLGRLSSGVVLRENLRKLDSLVVPLPQPP